MMACLEVRPLQIETIHGRAYPLAHMRFKSVQPMNVEQVAGVQPRSPSRRDLQAARQSRKSRLTEVLFHQAGVSLTTLALPSTCGNSNFGGRSIDCSDTTLMIRFLLGGMFRLVDTQSGSVHTMPAVGVSGVKKM